MQGGDAVQGGGGGDPAPAVLQGVLGHQVVGGIELVAMQSWCPVGIDGGTGGEVDHQGFAVLHRGVFQVFQARETRATGNKLPASALIDW